MQKKYSTFILYLFLFIYFELISKIFMFNQLLNWQFFFVLLFSITASLFLDFIGHFWQPKNAKVFHGIMIFALTVFYIFNYLYFSLFSVPFSISTLELASQAMDFVEIGFHLVMTKFLDVLLFLIPMVGYLFIGHSYFNYEKRSWKNQSLVLVGVLFFHMVSLLALHLDKNSLYSAYNLYYNIDSLTTSSNVLGVLSTQRLSLKRNLFGFTEKIVLNNEESDKNNEQVEYNQLDIDFDSLIENTSDTNLKDTYTYLANKEATNKNEYTGIYKGKNLIFILAEGFNSIAVSKELTPTLYKLIHEGFNFTNYYSPVFLSTTGGEFQAMTSLIPTQEILKVWRNNDIYLPYSLGNVFQAMDYNTFSFHNWSYKYYGRNHTMPLLGFTNFTACGNGLEKKINCKWLPSDVDLIDATFQEYEKQSPFVTYYITVSGHAPYNFNGGNSIALKNKELVEHLPYSEEVKSYLASQLELEASLKALINHLKMNNLLDDTVLVLTGDHYPYTLSVDEINEISTYERDETIEVNHSNLIIWNNKNVNTTIDKVASQLDVLPTLLNLFGIEYDSRLLLGNDIFSNAEGLAIFSNRSWITNQGTFDAEQGFVAKNGNLVDNNYIEQMNNRVLNSFTISKSIMENDLYRKLLNG